MVEPVEGPKHLLVLSLGNTGTVILDLDGQRAIVLGGAGV